jgi:hypothetical protein
MPPRLSAPFPEELVAFLNAQQDANNRRRYTCPSHPGAGLWTITAGLYCPRVDCDYTQDWVWSSGQIPRSRP